MPCDWLDKLFLRSVNSFQWEIVGQSGNKGGGWHVPGSNVSQSRQQRALISAYPLSGTAA
ncbi:hypothetical protein EIG16_08145 [Escherichia coli O8:H10]|nr:hypothetical protein [Escherichia coli O8:H10]EFN7289376.1 hypothetical protein [Escherichia coli O8:H10]HAJ5906864.1 hypothetical protein [Escherichia coli]